MAAASLQAQDAQQERADFETRYPHKRASVENPHDLATFDRKYDPKYRIGQVVTEENNPLEGIIILAYDYPRDEYTIAYAYQRGGKWNYDPNATYERSENRYRETIRGRIISSDNQFFSRFKLKIIF